MLLPPEHLILISGPCVIEDPEYTFAKAAKLKDLFSNYPDITFIFKASYDKANRTSIHSFRGPGVIEGLKVLGQIKKDLNIPIITDIHSPQEAELVGDVCDIIQIPAFLCRQTDLLLAAAETQKTINLKKGQFLSPWDIEAPVEKILSKGNNKIILTERGCSFGYNNLVSDMRSIEIMKRLGFPVIFDGTHSVQLPGGLKSKSGGQTEFVPTLTKAAIAAGAHGLFIESHPNPLSGKSDASSMISFEELETLVPTWNQIFKCVNPCKITA